MWNGWWSRRDENIILLCVARNSAAPEVAPPNRTLSKNAQKKKKEGRKEELCPSYPIILRMYSLLSVGIKKEKKMEGQTHKEEEEVKKSVWMLLLL